MKSIRLIPPARTFFEELKIKPANRFPQGLFVKGGTKSKLLRGGQMPQGLISLQNNQSSLSDDVLGDAFTMIGIGCDPIAVLDKETQDQWRKIGGQFLYLSTSHLSSENLHVNTIKPIDDFISSVPQDWIVITRPDRVIMHDGPLSQTPKIINQVLNMLKE